MKPSIFISYSRLCVGFVDDLAHRLEKEGFKVWLDYRSLIPGRPWVEQIDAGLEESQLLLLVVSKEAIASANVELEWRRFLEDRRRVILLIFEAVPLPAELAALEWIDFRGGYGSAVRRLLHLIQSPAPMGTPAPQHGFKAPAVVWLAAFFSSIISVYSLFAAWTFLIPWVLAPLPARVFKRNFNISQVQTALWTLPLGLFFSLILAFELGLVSDATDFDYAHYFSLYNFVLLILFLQVFFIPLNTFLLLLILRSPGMQRWGRPEASLVKFANPYHPRVSRPEPVHFHIDHAAEDSRIAQELSKELVKYGHIPAGDIDSAEEVLVLVSRYKTDTAADPEGQIVYPIMIQRARISDKLSRMQWIDFRKGVRNLQAIAQLLPQPARMLAALGVRPTSGSQSALPNIVLAMVDFLIIMAMLDLGSFISFILELQHIHLGLILERETERTLRLLSLEVLSMALIGALIYFMIRALTERHGKLAAPGPFLLGILGMLALFIWQGDLGDELEVLFNLHGIATTEAMFAYLPFIFFIIGGLLVVIAALFNRRDVMFWFPARAREE